MTNEEYEEIRRDCIMEQRRSMQEEIYMRDIDNFKESDVFLDFQIQYHQFIHICNHYGHNFEDVKDLL